LTPLRTPMCVLFFDAFETPEEASES